MPFKPPSTGRNTLHCPRSYHESAVKYFHATPRADRPVQEHCVVVGSGVPQWKAGSDEKWGQNLTLMLDSNPVSSQPGPDWLLRLLSQILVRQSQVALLGLQWLAVPLAPG